MLRIHFTAEDLSRTRLAERPDPLWEITASLHRLQSKEGRWAHAAWYRDACDAIATQKLGAIVRTLLFPLFPRASYFPDFLTPGEAGQGLRSGLGAILDTPPARVRHEIGLLAQVRKVPSEMYRLADRDTRLDLVTALRRYHEAVIAPYHDSMQARIDAEGARQGRALLHGGAEVLLGGLGPAMRWKAPVLEVDYVGGIDRDLRLDGRGLLLIPSYFCWQKPVSFADPDLPPVLLYPLAPADRAARPGPCEAPLSALLGRTRAAVLLAVTYGATNSEIARAVSVSTANASHHTTVLRDAGLIASHRHANTVLHTLTPLGASLLRLPDQDRRVTVQESQGPKNPVAVSRGS
ncbi:winged helix-turn-helix domain-containing protein [Streptomyces sp. ME02-8801-2C]|uniref:ArsR/SmtB family transcription factor n=1 Tax=Streptomyces sp. ME02-8801-2C TaxID=3028680 RepID=UPI0029BA559F|nr:winged helix-turn-helix domain-containing protein [Streptomyces sp. ME02-8801-2C]MDX3453710.1 winged helix-turn-helix domain-containing protein [Streptomyces sp. ME02-8801-2C]